MPTPFDILDGNAAHQTFNAYGADNNTLLTSILAKLNASLAVTGTFFQATQPVSGTITANAGTGTFAVSGPLTDTQLRATAVPVSGTFWQATQPVSGTFWQATQPVSLAALPALVAGTALVGKVGIDQTTPGTTNAFSQTHVGSTAVATGNGVVSAGVQRVAIASDNTAFSVNALQSGTWNIGTVTTVTTVSTVTNLSQFGGSAINLGAGAVSTGTLRTTQASDSPLVTATGAVADAAAANGASGSALAYLRSIKDAATDTTTPSPVSAPTLTKGTQSANGFSVQELKDAGRSTLCMTAEFAFAQTAETLLTMTLSADGAATSTFSSRVITSGKKFRIQSLDFEIETLGSGTAPQRAYLRLRRNTAGATTASTALQTVWSCVNNTAVVKSGAVMHADFPDGIEMNGDGTATFGFTLETPDWVTTTATGRAKITVIGVEF